MLKPFDIEFQPFIQEIDEKEVVLQKYADAATMERVKSMTLHVVLGTMNSNVGIQTSKMTSRI